MDGETVTNISDDFLRQWQIANREAIGKISCTSETHLKPIVNFTLDHVIFLFKS